MKQKIIIKGFSGGISSYDKIGIKDSARFIKSLNIHEDPGKITLMPAMTKSSGSTVTDLVKWGVDTTPFATDKYFYDLTGNIYKLTSGGTWSVDRAGGTVGNGTAGQGMAVFDDYLYYATSTSIGRNGKLSGTPAYDDDFLTDGTTNVDQSGGGTGAADYVPPTSISEVATARQTFTPTRDPVKAIIIDVDVVGSGDWTVTLHDSNDVSIGSVAIVNGSMSTGDITFTFSTALEVTIDNEYHFHVTSTVADGGVDTDVATDLEGAEFSTLFGILKANTDWHPMIEHLNFLAIGNNDFIAKWDRATYNPNFISLKRGLKVRGLGKWREWLTILAVPNNTISDTTKGRIYYWDGVQSSFNFFDDVSFGAPNTIFDQRNELIGVYGTNGGLYLGNAPFQEVQPIPNLARGKNLEVAPSGITGWNGKTYFGVGFLTDDGSSLEQGVYEYGSKGDQFDEVLNYAFPISTGTTQATTVKIGMVKSFGDTLYVGFRDNTTYGVDTVKMSDNSITSGVWESLIFDDGNPQKEKLALKIVTTFEALVANQTITNKYKMDRAASFTGGTAVSTVGATRAETRLPVASQRHREMEWGFTIASSDGSYPVVTSTTLFFDDLREESDES